MCFSFIYKKHKCIHLFIHLAIVIETYNVAGTGLGLKSQWLWGLVIRVYERSLFEEKWKEYVKVFWDTFTNDIFVFKDSFQRYIMFWMGAVWWRSVTGGNVGNVHVNYLKAIYLRQMSHITGEKKKFPAWQSTFLQWKQTISNNELESTLIMSPNSQTQYLWLRQILL